MYKTTVFCPVCHKVMDVITHSTEKPNAMAMALLCNDGRREHAISNPSCTKSDKWHIGWDIETKEESI